MSVYAFGNSQCGQLGTGEAKESLDPVVIEGLKGKRITNVSCGDQHSIATTGSLVTPRNNVD